MYKVTVEKIETKVVPTKEYEIINEDMDTRKKEYGYVDTEKVETFSTLLYEQRIEGEINLNGIINAVNNTNIQ